MAPRARPLSWEYLARVINIPAVQCHREAVTDHRTAQFFSEGRRPDTLDFQWFLDEPDLSFWEPLASAISPISLQAWNAAFVAFLGFVGKLASGELIANGVYQATGVRHDLDRAEWTRERLILDVGNSDLIEVGHGKRTVRWSAMTVRAAIPERKLGRIDWDDWWEHEVDRRAQHLLPNKKDYLREAEPLIKERYGVSHVPETELRRIKAALYRGDLQRPKRKPTPKDKAKPKQKSKQQG
jgi:hypothetical protein